MSSAAFRRKGRHGQQAGQRVTVDCGAGSAGLHGWLDGLGAGHALAAAFDTRLRGVRAVTGRASQGIGRLLKRHGYRFAWSSLFCRCHDLAGAGRCPLGVAGSPFGTTTSAEGTESQPGSLSILD